MQGCQLRRSPWIACALLAVWLVSSAAANPVRLVVEDDLADLAAALVDAYGAPVELVGAAPDLVLALGEPAWDEFDAVAVAPGVTLRATSDAAGALDLQRFATSPAAQRALIAAGFLPASATVRDQEGRTVTVPQPVERVYAAYGVATYLVYALGAGDRLVVGNYLGARDPEGAAAMERIDPRFPERNQSAPQDTTNAEFVASVGADLVFAGGGGDWTRAVEALGIPLVGFAGESPALLREQVRIAGAVLGPHAAARAEAWVAYYDHVLASVERSLAGVESRPRVLFTGTSRTRVASGAMLQSTLIELAGGTSVTAHLGGGWNDVDVERVLTWDPAYVLVAPYGQASVEAIVDDPEWRLLGAVREGRVVRVPKLVAPWDTPVPDSVLAVVWLAETLHGELAELSCGTETSFFYRRFYDYPIGADEVAALCGR